MQHLCRTILTLGEEKLCNICTEHPRYYEWFGSVKEGGIGLCCEEAAGAADEEALLAYVRRLVQLWRGGEPMLKDQNQQAVEAYAYPGLAQTLSRWMAE